MLQRFAQWPKTAHFHRERQRKPNHSIVTPTMILRAIDSPHAQVKIQRNGNIVFIKEIVEANIIIRVVLKPNGNLHSAYRDDVSMLELNTEAEKDRWL